MESRTRMMKPSKGINGVEDRLSDMPDHLIVHILSFLPTLDAVKTMLLRRFGNLWTLVPVLSLNCDDSDSCDWFGDFFCFARFVRNVLMLHRSPTVDRFDLIISVQSVDLDLEDPMINDVQMWLRFAIDKQVKDLNFFFTGFRCVTIPRCTYTCQSLVKLTLFCCVLEHQPHLDVNMGSLRELSLSCVEGGDEAINQFLSGCPSLQEVKIYSCDDLHVLNVTSSSVSKLCLDLADLDHSFTLSCPYVKTLDISGSFNMPDVVDASSLQVVNIMCLPDHWSRVKAFLRQIRNVEVFTLSSGAFEQLSQGRKTNFPQNRWKRIVLWASFKDEERLQLILELAKSSVKLEELVIYSEYSSGSGEYLNPEFSATTYLMPLLKNVFIHGCDRFYERQLQLIELLLRNAVALEKLVITFNKSRIILLEEFDFVKQVSTFRRASANATVIFA